MSEVTQKKNFFIAGWRPAIGWICGFALAWHFFLAEMVVWVYTLFGGTMEFPDLTNADGLLPLVLGVLGLGAARTVEKVQGKDGSTVSFGSNKNAGK